MTKEELNSALKRTNDCKERLVIQMKAQIDALRCIMNGIMIYSPESQDSDWYNEAVSFIDEYEDTLAFIEEEYQLH